MKRRFEIGIPITVIILVIAMCAVALAGSTVCLTWRTKTGQVIQPQADKFLKNAPANSNRIITSPDLLKAITDTDTAGNKIITNDPLTLDVRTQAAYDAGHIPGAIFIASYDQMATTANLDKLDKAICAHYNATGNDDIVVYCVTGHTGAFVTAALCVIGYDAKNLRFGYNIGWLGKVTTGTGGTVTGINSTPGPVEVTPAP